MSDDSKLVSLSIEWARKRHELPQSSWDDAIALRMLADEVERLTWALEKASEQAERYAFAKTLEGQVVTMETFKNLGASFLDEKLDEAMAADEAWGKS